MFLTTLQSIVFIQETNEEIDSLNKSSNDGLIKNYRLKIIFRIFVQGLVQRVYSFLINNLWKSHPVLNENFDEEPLEIQLYGNKQSLQTMSF